MTFLRNTWYVAGWSAEIGQQPMTRKFLNEQVVMYRNPEGGVVAGSNLCPHRFAPLHLGKVVDGLLECPYHGLRFDGEGRCVHNPDGEGRIPSNARLRMYPTHEKWGAVWIWMGDVEKADPALVHDFPFLSDPAHFHPVTGTLHVRANYRYVNDNVMDQAHLHMVHRTTLACDSIRRSKSELVVDDHGTIWSNRFGTNDGIPAIFQLMWRVEKGEEAGDDMDHWVEGGWNPPALVRNNTGVTKTGRPREEGIETKNAHFFTPETETTTHYFWAIARNFKLDDPALDEQIRQGTEYAFIHEDEAMLHAIQEAMGQTDFWSLKPLLLQADVGMVRLRRELDRLIAAEQAERVGDARHVTPIAVAAGQ